MTSTALARDITNMLIVASLMTIAYNVKQNFEKSSRCIIIIEITPHPLICRVECDICQIPRTSHHW